MTMADPARPLAIRNVTILTLDERGSLPGHTLVVEAGRIRRIVPDNQAGLPGGVQIIDGGGGYLSAGLCDMHVHVGLPFMAAATPEAAEDCHADVAAELQLYLAHGITSLRNMSGHPLHVRLRDEVRSGALAGPNVFSTSALRDGARVAWSFGVATTSRQQAQAAVDEAVAAGHCAMKVYNDLAPEVYDEIVVRARAAGLPVVGHVPFDVGIDHCLQARQDSIEHFKGYEIAPGSNPRAGRGWVSRAGNWLGYDAALLGRWVQATLAAGTVNCPTFVVVEAGLRAARGAWDEMPLDALPPRFRHMVETYRLAPPFPAETAEVLAGCLAVQKAFALQLFRAGAPLCTGTDAGVYDILPGASLHCELWHLVDAGLTPAEVMRCATRPDPRLLQVEPSFGVLQPGARADLALFAADPTRDIGNVATICGTMVAGRWYPGGLSAPHRKGASL